MHRQFFRPSGSPATVAWEPPVDILETERAVLVLVALPGVDFDDVKAIINQGELLISGCRTYPDEMRTAIIHRLELPQGRFERRIRLPAGRYNAIHRSDSNGYLLITLQKAEPSNG
jgi:HSP20 family molecular chaperone IbpA